MIEISDELKAWAKDRAEAVNKSPKWLGHDYRQMLALAVLADALQLDKDVIVPEKAKKLIVEGVEVGAKVLKNPMGNLYFKDLRYLYQDYYFAVYISENEAEADIIGYISTANYKELASKITGQYGETYVLKQEELKSLDAFIEVFELNGDATAQMQTAQVDFDDDDIPF